MDTQQLTRRDRAVVSAQVSKETRERLERLAAQNKRNVSQEIRRALAKHLGGADDDGA